MKVVTLIAGHYVYYDARVEKATKQLYRNLKGHGIIDNPQTYVEQAIKKAILRYVETFKLKGSTTKIMTTIK